MKIRVNLIYSKIIVKNFGLALIYFNFLLEEFFRVSCIVLKRNATSLRLFNSAY